MTASTVSPPQRGGAAPDRRRAARPEATVEVPPDAARKLNPATLWRNPVMFIVEVGSVFTTVLAIAHPTVFAWVTTVWLWLTVVFANLAEAVAEGPRQGAGGDAAGGEEGHGRPAGAGLEGRRDRHRGRVGRGDPAAAGRLRRVRGRRCDPRRR